MRCGWLINFLSLASPLPKGKEKKRMIKLNLFTEDELTAFSLQFEISKWPVWFLQIFILLQKKNQCITSKFLLKCKHSNAKNEKKTYWVLNVDFSSGREINNLMFYLQEELNFSKYLCLHGKVEHNVLFQCHTEKQMYYRCPV